MFNTRGIKSPFLGGIVGRGACLNGLPLGLELRGPGEVARLLGITAKAVQDDRFSALRQLQQKFNANVMLKGAGSLTLTDDSDNIGLCAAGNPGMASGGMGDVLAGIIGGLMAQKLSPALALPLGVCLHAAAADIVAEEAGPVGLLAADLYVPLRQLINGLTRT